MKTKKLWLTLKNFSFHQVFIHVAETRFLIPLSALSWTRHITTHINRRETMYAISINMLPRFEYLSTHDLKLTILLFNCNNLLYFTFNNWIEQFVYPQNLSIQTSVQWLWYKWSEIKLQPKCNMVATRRNVSEIDHAAILSNVRLLHSVA